MSEGNGYHTLLFSIVALLGIFNVPRCLDISDTWYTAPTFIRSPCDRPGPVVFNQPLPKDIPRQFGGSRIRTCGQKLPPDYKDDRANRYAIKAHRCPEGVGGYAPCVLMGLEEARHVAERVGRYAPCVLRGW